MIEVPLTDAQFTAAAQRLREHGVELTGPSGTLSKEGITARYEHANGRLTIEIVKKPVFLPVSVIENRLRAYIDQALASDLSRASNAS